jgi:hypothetical protein
MDMSARDLADLFRPVIPHAKKEKDYPQLAHIRVEAQPPRYVHAVASDRYTLASELHVLSDQIRSPGLIHVALDDANAALKLFPFSKDDDPELVITLDRVPVPSQAPVLMALEHLALTITAPDGTRMVMRDRRNPDTDHLQDWRENLAAAMARAGGAGLPAVQLAPWMFARWGRSVHRGESLTVFAAREGARPLLILAGGHFAGLWTPTAWPEDPAGELRKHTLWDLLGAGEPGDQATAAGLTSEDDNARDGDL